MSTELQFGRDNQAYSAYAPRPSTNIYSAKLTANSAATITLPTNVKNWVVAFSYTGGSEVWVDFTGATAAAPTLGTFSATTSCRNPGVRYVQSTKVVSGVDTATTISLITPDATAYVSVELWVEGTNVI
jgi:hypothetical protein